MFVTSYRIAPHRVRRLPALGAGDSVPAPGHVEHEDVGLEERRLDGVVSHRTASHTPIARHPAEPAAQLDLPPLVMGAEQVDVDPVGHTSARLAATSLDRRAAAAEYAPKGMLKTARWFIRS